jgi:hypothetical protein
MAQKTQTLHEQLMAIQSTPDQINTPWIKTTYKKLSAKVKARVGSRKAKKFESAKISNLDVQL